MGITEFNQCAAARGDEYGRAAEWVSAELGDSADEFWREFKEWFDSLDDSTKWIITILAGQISVVAREYIMKALAAVFTAATLELLAAIVAGVGLGVLIDLVRECADQL